MSLKKLAVLAAVVAMLPTAAAAQTSSLASTSGVNWNVIAPMALEVAPDAAAMQPGGGRAARRFALFLLGGLWAGAGTGFLGGAGLDLDLIAGEQYDTRVSGAFLRVEGLNGFLADFNFFWNFLRENSNLTPFAGGGLIFTSLDVCGDFDDIFGFDIDCGGTSIDAQVGGGVKIPRGNGSPIIIQLLLPFGYSNPFLAEVIWPLN